MQGSLHADNISKRPRGYPSGYAIVTSTILSSVALYLLADSKRLNVKNMKEMLILLIIHYLTKLKKLMQACNMYNLIKQIPEITFSIPFHLVIICNNCSGIRDLIILGLNFFQRLRLAPLIDP